MLFSLRSVQDFPMALMEPGIEQLFRGGYGAEWLAISEASPRKGAEIRPALRVWPISPAFRAIAFLAQSNRPLLVKDTLITNKLAKSKSARLLEQFLTYRAAITPIPGNHPQHQFFFIPRNVERYTSSV